MTRTPNYSITDGNSAAAHSAHLCSDVFMIYPITPSTQGNELADAWSSAGRKNIFDEVPEVYEMQAEGILHLNRSHQQVELRLPFMEQRSLDPSPQHLPQVKVFCS
ncbi:hypothetical protein GEMRC1_000258 [Eukaryota sp. GEM-RC1]